MKIQWLKIDTEILNNDKIKLIRKHPGGDSLLVVWIGLLCIAMKSSSPGIVKLAENLPYSPDDLAILLDVETKTVELAITLFCKYGMIAITEGGLMEIVGFRDHQSIDRIEHQRELNRTRQIEYRKRNANVNVSNETEKNRIEKKRKDIDYNSDSLFVSFWEQYDNKKDKLLAYKAFKKLSKEDKENAIKSIVPYKASLSDIKYLRYPATYINKRTWENEFTQPKQQSTHIGAKRSTF
jgi:predicted phage replisome organizer